MQTNWDIVAVIGTGVSVVGFVYMFFRNFKQDILSQINSVENRIEARMNALDERMFYLYTGRSLKDAIIAERIKLDMDKKE